MKINEQLLMTNRERHLEWCKKRAREYLDRGDGQSAFTSFESDMGKHEETAKQINNDAINTIKMVVIVKGLTVDGVRRYIEGFP